MQKPRLNHQIRTDSVRIVDPPLGVMSHANALARAAEDGLDLIEITPGANPPVCIIKDIGKWKYEQSKKAKGMKQFIPETKQIQIRPVTEVNDLQTKARQITAFLDEGHHVRVVVKYRGRELAHIDEGEAALARLVELAGCVIDTKSGLDGKQLVVTVKKR